MTEFVAGFGEFFGGTVQGQFFHEATRYQPQLRMDEVCRRTGVDTVLGMLADEMSRFDFLTTVSAEPASLWKHWWRDLYNGLQYFDYVSIEPGSTILNCGVHGGAEIPHFLVALRGEGRLVNIDPLGHSYLLEPAKAFIASFDGRVDEVAVALHHVAETLRLPVELGGMAAGNHIGESLAGTKLMDFRAASIDMLIDELSIDRVDLIKMDIEGAEPRALRGALRTLARFRPSLAISIYHEPDHFVEIPLFLRERLTDYDFFVRSYHFIANEVILYAIPKERPRRARLRSITVNLEDDLDFDGTR